MGLNPFPRPIFRLPHELLTAIFAMLSDDQVSGLPQDPESSYSPPETLMHWVRLMLVCRHWRDVGISSPWLWRRISITGNMESLQYRLARSVGCTIDVFFSGDGKGNDLAMSLLIPLAHRIRSIDATEGFHLGALPSIKPLFQVVLPALESVKVLPDFDFERPPNPENGDLDQSSAWFDLGLSGKLYPRIRTLEVHRIVLPSPPAFASLQELIINIDDIHMSDDQHPLSPDDIVNVFAHARCLETLEVGGCDVEQHFPPNYATPASLKAAPLTKYHLPCLRKVILHCPFLFAASVLRVIDAPALAIFDIEVSTDSPIATADICSLMFPPSLRHVVQQHTELLVATADENRWGFMVCDAEAHKLDGDTVMYEHTSNWLHLEVSDYTHTISPLPAALTMLATAFEVSPQVHSLYFADFGRSSPRSYPVWDPIPTIFPAVRSITVCNCSPSTVTLFLHKFIELSNKGVWSTVQDLHLSTGAGSMPNSFGLHAIADLVLETARVREERGAPLTLVDLEHKLSPSTPLLPHRWTLLAINVACEDFDFRIFRGDSHMAQRLDHLFTTEEQQHLLDGTWAAYAATKQVADGGAGPDDEDELEEDEAPDDEIEHLCPHWKTLLKQLQEVVPKAV